MFIRILPTTLILIFCEILLYFQVIFKSMKIADDTFLGNSECEWVNQLAPTYLATAIKAKSTLSPVLALVSINATLWS